MTTPASYPTGANDAFNSGVAHPVNPGRANGGSITLGTDASNADQGLDQTAQRWADLTPRAVLASATGTGLDYAGTQRLAGSYSPGSMGRFSDELSGGSDDYQSGEE